MSEYQYYDFRAIDRPLAKAELAELRSISTRAAITSTSFTNHYEWGSLKANPLKLLEKYFDAFLYVANWGTREFFLRLPLEQIDYHQIGSMVSGEETTYLEKTGKYLIVGFTTEFEDDGEWDDGTGWMGSLMSLRSEVLRGDLRCLYLGWLLGVQHEEISHDQPGPPVPAGLGELSAPLRSMLEFLGIDEDLVEIAASASATIEPGPDQKELAAWIRSLPEKDKNDILLTAVLDSSERWRTQLLRGFHQHGNPMPRATGGSQRRTAGDIISAARVRAEERRRRLEAERTAEEARRTAQKEAERQQYLDRLEKFEQATWNEVTAQIQKRQPNGYDSAVQLLIDLRDVARRRQEETIFHLAVESLRQKHASKSSFLQRLAKAGL